VQGGQSVCPMSTHMPETRWGMSGLYLRFLYVCTIRWLIEQRDHIACLLHTVSLLLNTGWYVSISSHSEHRGVKSASFPLCRVSFNISRQVHVCFNTECTLISYLTTKYKTGQGGKEKERREVVGWGKERDRRKENHEKRKLREAR
jgi:hypothetical protein